MQTGDIIRIRAIGNYLGQEVLNVFDYQVDALGLPVVPLFTVLDEWHSDFVAMVQRHFVSAWQLTELDAENLTNGLEIAKLPVTSGGNFTGEGMPSFTAVGVKLNRQTRITRNGAKRFVGVPEEIVNFDTLTMDASARSEIEQFCGNLRVYPDVDGNGTIVQLQPVIIGRTLDANQKYQLDLNKINIVLNAEVKDFVTTQNTRKV